VRTFDVFVASREPEWTGRPVSSYGWSGKPAAMTPAAFLTLWATLPTAEELRTKSPAIERRLAAWEATHRDAAVREPAQSMLKAVREELAGRGLAPSSPPPNKR